MTRIAHRCRGISFVDAAEEGINLLRVGVNLRSGIIPILLRCISECKIPDVVHRVRRSPMQRCIPPVCKPLDPHVT